MDFCYFNLMFCMENDFSPKQTSAFYSIMLKVFKAAVDERMPSDDAFELFKDCILKHSIDDGDAVELYPFNLVKKITSYVSNTFFRYLDAYVYVFSTSQSVTIEKKTLQVDTPLSPPKLGEAVAEEAVFVYGEGEDAADAAGSGAVGNLEGQQDAYSAGGEGGQIFELSV